MDIGFAKAREDQLIQFRSKEGLSLNVDHRYDFEKSGYVYWVQSVDIDDIEYILSK